MKKTNNFLYITAIALLSISLVINIKNFYFEKELPLQFIQNTQKKLAISANVDNESEIKEVEEPNSATDSPNPQIAGIIDNNRENIVESNSNDSIKSTVEDKNDTVGDSDLFSVQRVIDGDTIELVAGEIVRYIGIDTPESVHPDKDVMCYGWESAQINRQLVEGKNIRLEKDVSEKDRYNRLLRYVYLEDGTFINLYLVKNGYATSYTYPPDVKYQDLFREAELEARNANTGLWAACQDNQATTTSPQPSTSGNCQIKGNINSSGEKIYHLPGQRYYDKTVINESKGERWFCSEDEAQSAGWRKSKI